MDELDLLEEADRRGRAYVASASRRRVFPDAEALSGLAAFEEPWPAEGRPAIETLAVLDRFGSPATAASTGPRYFGFVLGGALPAAAAAERLAVAWDQAALTFDSSPVAHAVERRARAWLLEALDLPRDAGVGFGTSATAGALVALTAARSRLLRRAGWDVEAEGLAGAPELRVVLSETAHVTVRKALRILGFGMNRLVIAPVDGGGRIDPERLPPLDDRTILCLQAGEVNTGAFDPFDLILPRAQAAGAWTHVDGAFGLWARAAPARRGLTRSVDLADSWTVDGHKWLNTPYDGSMTIVRDEDALARAMNSDAAYAHASRDSQKNLTLEFSRRARGLAIWAALRSLGRSGLAAMIERHCRQARLLADGLAAAGFEVLNDVSINQVLVRCARDEDTTAILRAAQDSGEIWFGGTMWQGRPAFRLSVSCWRTQDSDIDHAVKLLTRLLAERREIF